MGQMYVPKLSEWTNKSLSLQYYKVVLYGAKKHEQFHISQTQIYFHSACLCMYVLAEWVSE